MGPFFTTDSAIGPALLLIIGKFKTHFPFGSLWIHTHIYKVTYKHTFSMSNAASYMFLIKKVWSSTYV